jgi:hypothetical protein
VAGGQHHTKIGIAGLGKKRHPRSRQNAESYHVHPSTCQTSDNGRFQEFP